VQQGKAVVRYKPLPHTCADCHKAVPPPPLGTRRRTGD
jgi:hypothetical protein